MTARTLQDALPAGAYLVEVDGARTVHRNGLDVPLVVTRFEDEKAQSKRDAPLTLRQMADDIAAKSAQAKRQLPWLKLAQFGDARTDRGSLRHKENMEAVYGIEGDYDAGAMTPEAAADLLRQAGIAGLIYTSPSHHTTCPEEGYKGERWRVLCALSRPHETSEREELTARLNGVLGGVLAGESFTDAQSYYYGKVGDAPDHRVILVDGKALDHAPELETKAIGRPGGSAKLTRIELPTGIADSEIGTAALQLACAMFDDTDRVKDTAAGGRHKVMLSATMAVAPYVAGGVLDFTTAHDAIVKAMADCEGGKKLAFPTECSDALRSAMKMVDPYRPEAERLAEARAEFDALETETEEQRTEREAREAKAKAERDAEDAAKARAEVNRYRFLTYDDLCAMPDPAWLVEGLMPLPSFGVIWGEYASLKSYWILDVMTHIALGKSYGGRRVEEGRCFYLLGEGLFDARYRLAAAFQKHGAKPNGNVLLMDRAILLLSAGDVDGFIRAVKEQELLDHVPTRLIVIDTIARALPGQNSNAVEVMTAATEAAEKIKREIGCSVCLIGHAGKDRSKGLMGSVATPAAVDYEFSTDRQREPEHVLTVANVKQKYAPEAPDMWFDVKVTDLETGGDALSLHERPLAPGKAKAANPKHEAVLRIVREMTDEGVEKLDKAAVIERCTANRLISSAERATDRRKAAAGYLSALVAEGHLAESGERIWFAEGVGLTDLITC